MRHIVSPFGRHVLATALTAAALAAAMPSAFAASPVVASGSASLSNLQLQVSDFLPDDGVTAGVKWVTLGQGWAEASCCDGTSSFTHNAFREIHFTADKFTNAVPNGTSLVGGAASAMRTADGVKASVLVDADHIGSIYSGGKYDPGSSLGVQAFLTAWGFELSLKPGTEIKVTGVTTLDAQMNLLNTDKHGMPGYLDLVGSLSGQAYLQANPQWGSDTLQVLTKPEGPEAFASGTLYQKKSAGQIIAGDSQLHESQPFTFVIRNNGNQAQSVYFSMYTDIRFSGDHGYVGSIPEPESVALMLVGLASLAWMRRRQQRSQLAKQVAAVCMGAALLPMGAQAAAVVSAQGAIHVVDKSGESHGGFDVEPKTEFFYGSSTGDAPGSVRAFAGHDEFGLRVAVSASDSFGYYGELVPSQLASSSSSLDWSDTITNTTSQSGKVSISFAMPQFIWSLSDEASFRLSISIDGQTSPIWFTAFDRQFDATQNRAVTTFTGKDIGLRGDAYLANLALARDVQLGSLAAGGSLKVHFSVDLAAKGADYAMNFSTSEPLLKLVTSPVPEPAGWAMGLAGLGLMGAFARRRQAA